MNCSLLQDGLEYWRRQTPAKAAFSLDDTACLTYGELGDWSDGIAEYLHERGVTPGDNVAITGANSVDWVAAAFGVLKAGAVIVPFNERFVRDEMAYLVDFSAPRLIVADRTRAEVLNGVANVARIVPMESLAAHRDGASSGWRAPRVDSTALAIIMFTSGTTDRPKGVMYAHGSHLAKFYEQLLVERSLGSDTRIYMPFAISSGPGCSWCSMLCTLIGGTMYFTQKFDPDRALRTLAKEKISYLAGMPLIYEQVSRVAGFAEADLSQLKFAVIGGARVSRELIDTWRNKGVVIRNLYGMTEVGGAGIQANETDAIKRPYACGRGMIFTRVRVVDGNGADCAPNQAGNVLLRGPGMMVGYWRNPEATARAVIDGWMHTGDIGSLDEEGFFTFIDRSKDMIISGGFKISPSDVEAVLSQVKSVYEVAVFPVPDDKFGETPCACVYGAGEIEGAALFAHCRERLAGYKLPRYIICLETPLPRMSSGKINKRLLKQDYADAPRRFPRLG
jgi:fatty-acyl-CoA synthase